MGDDSQTDQIDGLVSGEELIFHIWDANLCEEFMGVAEISNGPNTFTTNGITFVNDVIALSFEPTYQEISLPSGWSMFSTFMIPDESAFGNLLIDIVEDVIIAKDYLGAAYLPEFNFDGIGDLTLGRGYQIKMLNSTDLIVAGDYIRPSDNPILLPGGWYIVAYYRTELAAVDAVFSDIVEDVLIVKDYSGNAYLPEFNFNGIGQMRPGQGYHVKTSLPSTLQYLSNNSSYRSFIETTINEINYFNKINLTDNNMTVVIEDAAWDIRPTEGAEIAAFDKDGDMVGSAIYSSPVTVVSVWGDDATSASKDGMLVSEPVSFKVWNTNEVLDFTVEKWIEGSSFYQVDGISVASRIETNNSITELNATERVLVKVINVLGQEVNLEDQPFKGVVLFNVYDDGSVEKFIQ
jgi:hypothetical protein